MLSERNSRGMIAERILSALPRSSLSENGDARVLLVGAGSSGKTSLAFKIAYDCAAEGGSPWFICNQTKIEGKLPTIVITDHGSGNDNGGNSGVSSVSSAKMMPEILSRISMKYVSSMNELKAVFSGLHALTPTPSLIVIDDFSMLVDPLHSIQRSDPKFLEICITLGAYLNDAIAFVTCSNKDLHSTFPVRVVVTDSCEEPQFLSVMQKTTPAVCRIQLDLSTGRECGTLVLLQSLYTRTNDLPILKCIELFNNALIVR